MSRLLLKDSIIWFVCHDRNIFNHRSLFSWMNWIYDQFPIFGTWLTIQQYICVCLEWYTFCIIRPWALRIVGISLAVISVLVIWSEMTFFSTNPVLSIFARCVNTIRNHNDYFTLEVGWKFFIFWFNHFIEFF